MIQESHCLYTELHFNHFVSLYGFPLSFLIEQLVELPGKQSELSVTFVIQTTYPWWFGAK